MDPAATNQVSITKDQFLPICITVTLFSKCVTCVRDWISVSLINVKSEVTWHFHLPLSVNCPGLQY